MKILIAVLDWIRWIAGILLAMAIPFAWICRDGLGPDMISLRLNIQTELF